MMDHSLYTIQQLDELSNSSEYSRDYKHMNIRMNAIKDAALALGAQSGLANESKKIDDKLFSYSSKLDKVFDFNQLLINQNVLPPVISESHNSVNMGDGAQSFRLLGHTYKIIRQVKFVTAPPTWRKYLFMRYGKPALPNRILLPVNKLESDVWENNINLGWKTGVNQAFNIYKINISRLVRDYVGMLLYKKLVSEGIISPVYVLKKDNGITGDKNRVNIDDRVYEIKNHPELQANNHLWKPIIGDSDE